VYVVAVAVTADSRRHDFLTPPTEAVRVVVRLRPRNIREKKARDPRVTLVQVRVVLQLLHVCTLSVMHVRWPRHLQEDEEHVHIEDHKKGIAKSFRANQAFDGACSQRQMFDSSGIRELLDAAMEGFPVCAFAYGQTGSGKTHTIIGEESFLVRKGRVCYGRVVRAGTVSPASTCS